MPCLLRSGYAGSAFVIFIGLPLSVNALPVITKIMADLGILHRQISQLAISIAVVDNATVRIRISLLVLALHGEPSWQLESVIVALPAIAVLP